MKYVPFVFLALSLASCSTHLATDFGFSFQPNPPVVEQPKFPVVEMGR